MNPSLTPGYPITADLSLTEELPAPPGVSFRVWFAFDVRIGKIVAIKIYNDGRIEPVNSPPPVTTTPTGTATPAPVKPVVVPVIPTPNLPHPSPGPEPITPPFRENVYTRPLGNSLQGQFATSSPLSAQMPLARPSWLRRSWLKYAVWLLVVLAGGYAIYFYRKPLRKYGRKTYALVVASVKRAPALPTDSTTAVQRDSLPQPAKESALTDEPSWQVDTDMMKLSPPPIDPNEPSPPSPTPESVATIISLQDATRMLSRLSTIPAHKHSAIFRDVQLSFETYRTNGGDPLTINRLYVDYMGRAAQSITTYRQNGDPASKQYALNWYQTAYALKPTTDLMERMERLRTNTPQKQPAARKPEQRRSNAHATGRVDFEPDPEVN